MSRHFRFKQFEVDDSGAAMKVGTDAVLLGCLARAGNVKHILDIGTGTGLIALQLAQRFAQSTVDGVELESGAAAQAELNFKNSPWSHRLTAYQADVLTWETHQQYDLLVSNPPFYPTSFPLKQAQRSMARTQGTLTFDSLAKCAWELGNIEAWFWYILPAHMHTEMAGAMTSHRWHLRALTSISPLTGKPANRIVAGWGKQAGPYEESALDIRTSSQQYSEAYLELTREFYLFA
ncbi:MAG: hypothetical protein C0424_06395 [Sphingobacteriaceae bacterium]|nr:hypothetical protein [Sphingobacteriaceae bacterium]